MAPRPHVLVSVAMSVDGYIDDTRQARLMMSNAEDLDRVDEVRASVDAILVGANTIRRDNPRLLIRSAARQEDRIRRGLARHPLRATLTGRGALDVTARFFSADSSEKLVYTRARVASALSETLAGVATVVGVGETIDLGAVLDDLGARKVRRLLVEGGCDIHTQILSAGLADELHLVIAPFFVGERAAPRFVHPGRFPQSPERPMTLAQTRKIGDVVLLRYLVCRTVRDR